MIANLIADLDALHKLDTRAFPYADCRKLQQIGSSYSALIPDLDVYLSELAGYRGWGKRILKWPDDKIEEVHQRAGASFFDRFPAYAEQQAQITPTTVPDLYVTLDRANQTRAVLRELLAHLQREGTASTT
jgi:hypothetical protein